jgi:DNA-directed RNA polymerase subunit RPC12/RpoP
VTATLLAAPSLFDSMGEGATLDELIVSVWEDLSADRDVACPVCAEQMRPEYGAHARAIGGRCPSCASTIR